MADHYHKCLKCKTVWKHDDDCGFDQPSLEEVHIARQLAHTCPKCGRQQWMKYKRPSAKEKEDADRQAVPQAI